VHAAEIFVGAKLSPKTVRCRVRRSGIVIELDGESLAKVDADARSTLSRSISGLFPASLSGQSIGFAAYRNGSAFIGDKS
jgi:uncharacterized protein